jgi:chorismate-pyruvate lyase
MREDLQMQILTQTSDNVQKLFEVNTRIDERVKAIQTKQVEQDTRLETLNKLYNETVQRVIILESRNNTAVYAEVTSHGEKLNEIDKRLMSLEHTSKGNEGRWATIWGFAIQLCWIVMAAFVLYKLGLNPPNVP